MDKHILKELRRILGPDSLLTSWEDRACYSYDATGQSFLPDAAAQAVLDARAQFPAASLADLYDPLTMPPVLLKAHQTLDRAADAAYGRRDFKSEAERVAFLFDLHQKYTASLLPLAAKEKKPGRRKKTA